MNTADTNTLQLTRHIRARRERVFAAWIMPDQMVRWMGPATARAKSAEADARPGGAYQVCFDTPRGEMTVRGEYREIQAPKKLVFTWQWQNDEDWANITSVVTVEFAEKDGGTEVQLTHSGLPNAESRGHHEHGWNGTLDKLMIGFDVVSALRGPSLVNWNELLTSDVTAAASFYGQLFGWGTAQVPGLKGPYTIFKKGSSDVGGMMAHPMPGQSPQWLPYVSVESADASAAQITKLGGAILAPPMDIPNVGRIAIAKDPQGATFGIFQSAC